MPIPIKPKGVGCALIAVLLSAVCWGAGGSGSVRAGDGFRWAGVAEEVIGELARAEAAVRAGQPDQARQAVLTAYFGLFEDRKLEAAMRKELGQRHTVEVEEQFNALRKGAGAANTAAFGATVTALSAILRQDAAALDAAGVPEQVYPGR